MCRRRFGLGRGLREQLFELLDFDEHRRWRRWQLAGDIRALDQLGRRRCL
jgi:hypothetical protein